MSFYGTDIIFDGVPCSSFGLIVANVGGDTQNTASLGGKSKIRSDSISGRHDVLHYGVVDNNVLSFPVTMVTAEDGYDFDRYEVAAVAGWLRGHSEYKKLVICQPDFDGIFYRALVTDLTTVENGMIQVGYTATFTCDAPYAYRSAPDTMIACDGTVNHLYQNSSNVNDYYYPVIKIEATGSTVSIVNNTDGSEFRLDGLTPNQVINIDCKNQVMTSSNGDNLYQLWNTGMRKTFPRFVRGDNRLTLTGNFSLQITNEFPWNVGF